MALKEFPNGRSGTGTHTNTRLLLSRFAEVISCANFLVLQILSALSALEDAGIEDIVSKIKTFVESTSSQTRKRFATLLASTLVTTYADKANKVLEILLLKVEPNEDQVGKWLFRELDCIDEAARSTFPRIFVHLFYLF